MSLIRNWPFFAEQKSTSPVSKRSLNIGFLMNYLRFTTLLMCSLLGVSAMAQDVKFIKSNLVNLFNANTTAVEHGEQPIVITYPSNFSTEVRDAKGISIICIKSSTTNLDSMFSTDTPHIVGDGLITIGLSLNVGFDPGSNKFSGEDEVQTDYKKLGFTNVLSRRLDKKNTPIEELTATGPNGRRIYLAYIAMDNSGVTYRITYYHPEEYKASETLIWRKLIDNLIE
ncbi:hypothetical protein [Undibacterium sp. TS12]|uniref:hypothetical protein n=1 Tax=Undibacterium sp. TS12 TaxID=2908202 RepID=UPI001F4C5899|nr:hypothetical protein [Undibacterium sp. TS12]MCH8621481.1 hypothetical protein [Undibacterium sp. TS12]